MTELKINWFKEEGHVLGQIVERSMHGFISGTQALCLSLEGPHLHLTRLEEETTLFPIVPL